MRRLGRSRVPALRLGHTVGPRSLASLAQTCAAIIVTLLLRSALRWGFGGFPRLVEDSVEFKKMAAVVVPDCAQVVIQWLFAGSAPMSNVLYVNGVSSVPVTQALADSMFADVKAAFTSSALNAHMNTTTTLSGLTLKDVRTANGAKFQAAGAAAAGTGATDSYTPHAAAVSTLRTAQTGKSFRGRVYTSGLLETDFDAAGNIATATTTIITTFLNSINTSWTARGLRLVVASPALPARTDHNGNPLPAKGAFATQVTAIISRNGVPGSQRRRNKRR